MINFKAASVFTLIIAFAAAALIFFHKSHTSSSSTVVIPSKGEIGFLPLGDSYTIGQSVEAKDRWPNQLAAKFQSPGESFKIVANPAVTGYTSQDLINHELDLVKKYRPSFVSVQIGVNDYVQGVPQETFKSNLDIIIQSVKKYITNPQNIILVTIPDYGKTPTGAHYGDPSVSERAVRSFNTVIMQAGSTYNIPVADIFPASQAVLKDASLIADDGLHPSAKQYKIWTDIIYETMISDAQPKK